MLIETIEERRSFKIFVSNLSKFLNKFTKRRAVLSSTVKIETISKCFNFVKKNFCNSLAIQRRFFIVNFINRVNDAY